MARFSQLGNESAGSQQSAGDAPAHNFAPSVRVTLPAGSRTSALDEDLPDPITIRGTSGNPFGIERMLIGGDVRGVLASASARRDREVLWKPVHLSALREMFLYQRLQGLIQVANGTLTLNLENPTNEEKTFNVQLVGYAGASAIEQQQACLAGAAGVVPVPQLTVARGTVPAGVQGYEIDVPDRDTVLTFDRFFAGSDADLSSLEIALVLDNDVVRQKVLPSQLHDAFRTLGAARPYQVDPNAQLKLSISNYGQADADVTTLFETYAQPR